MATNLVQKQRPRPVADYSADFEVEDVKPGPRSARDKDIGLPRWQKQPKPTTAPPSACTLAKQPIADLDPHRLAQRQKQIDYGKNTIGYQRYLQQVPRNKRRRKGEQWLDPVTPDINQNISKRCFDGQVKVWRRALHKYDIQAEEEEQVRPLSFAERARLTSQWGDDVAVTTVPSSPTNSSRSRGSLDGYLEPRASDQGRKRCFERAFDHEAGGNPHPSKLLTSPAGPKPSAPQSAPPATAGDAEPAPTPAGRCTDAPVMAGRAGPRSGATSGLPKAPQTAPPVASTAARMSSRSTAEAVTTGEEDAKLSLRAGAAGEDLFREWEDEEYGGLEPLEDEELDNVEL